MGIWVVFFFFSPHTPVSYSGASWVKQAAKAQLLRWGGAAQTRGKLHTSDTCKPFSSCEPEVEGKPAYVGQGLPGELWKKNTAENSCPGHKKVK